jgi:hypothetical protein
MGITISATTLVYNLTIGPTPVYGLRIPTNNLLLYLDASNTNSYPGTGTVWYDLSLSGNTCYITGATFNDLGTKSGFIFNGVSNYVRVPVSNDPKFFNPYSVTTTGFTISLWLKTTDTTTTRTIYGETGSDLVTPGGNFVPVLVINKEGTIYAEGYWGGSSVGVTGTKICNDGNYHNVCITKSGNTLSLYVDSQFQGSINKTPSNYNNPNPYYHWIGAGQIGSRGTTPRSSYFNGTINNFIIYKRALTQTEITNLYNQYLPRFR